jgi:hypothetical protein
MNMRTLSCGALVALLAGCQTMTPTKPPAPPPGPRFVQSDCPDTINPRPVDFCAGNGCNIWVQVVWDVPTQSCRVRVGTTRMEVRGRQGEAVTMRWHLPANNWEFRSEPSAPPPSFATPITFTDPAQGASSQFSGLRVNPNTVFLDNARTAKGPFTYSVRVYHKRTGERIDGGTFIYNDF